MERLRVLVLAPDANPDYFSSALVVYSHSEALAKLHIVTLVTRSRNVEAFKRKQVPFHDIEAIDLPWLDRIGDWILRIIYKNTFTKQSQTALGYPFALMFEWRVWQQMRRRIRAGDFDVVLRLMPITSVQPSLFPYFLRRSAVPVIIGPINGGLPWPKGFSQAEKQREWISSLRPLCRLMPFARSTVRYAKAIVVGSSTTYAEFLAHKEKLFFVPENGISVALLDGETRVNQSRGKLKLIFVGGLVPIKGCDMAIRGATNLLRERRAELTIVGEGPEQDNLERLVQSLGIGSAVSFRGLLKHSDAMKCMREGDVFVFPSIRDFGAGVVFEALALGVVPIVIDFGGPGEIVSPEVGFKVALTNEADIIRQIEAILLELDQNRALLAQLRIQGMRYAQESLSWDGKARVMTKIMSWALGRGLKPELLPPKVITR